MKLSGPLLPVRQDIILRRYESPRAGIRRVQATAETQALLKLAGFCAPTVFAWYDVPVREDENGKLVVDVPCPGKAPMSAEDQDFLIKRGLATGWMRVVPTGDAAPGAVLEVIADTRSDHCAALLAVAGVEQYLDGHAYRIPIRREGGVYVVAGPAIDPPRYIAGGSDYDLKRFRVEVRIDDTWLQALIVDAFDEGGAGLAAVEQCIQKDSSLSYDVWSVVAEEADHAAALGGAVAGVSPGSGVSSAETRGGDSGIALDPGLARHSSPAFAVGGCLPGSGKLALEEWANQEMERYGVLPGLVFTESGWKRGGEHRTSSDESASQRWETPKCPVCGKEAVALAKYADGGRSHVWGCSCPKIALVPIRTFCVPMAEDEDVIIRFVGRVNRAIPAPHEKEDWVNRPLMDAEVHAAIAALHRVRSLADFESSPA